MANINFSALIEKPVESDDPSVTLRTEAEQAQLDKEYIFTGEGLAALAANTITSAIGPTNANGEAWESGSGPKHITLYKGNGSSLIIGVGSDIVFKDSNGDTVSPLEEVNNALPDQNTGTFRVEVDGEVYEVPINGLAGGSGAITLSGDTTIDGSLTLAGDLIPSQNNAFDLGSSDPARRWKDLYLSGQLNSSSTAGYTGASEKPDTTTYNVNAIQCSGGAYFAKNLSALRVYNAVFNDYAEYRTTINLTPGHVVIDQDDGSLACSTARLQSGAQVISDTFGHAMGQTFEATTPIAVAGRVLAYTYQPRENYHAGMAVCSAPDGTVDIMTREEIRDYPDCIVGIVSEIPQYETWGSDNVKVDGRIWIKI